MRENAEHAAASATSPEPVIAARLRTVAIEEIWHEGGPASATPVAYASAVAAVANPFAGRCEPDLMEF